MIKELGWYLETGRFTGIVSELDALAEDYAVALAARTPERFSKRQLLVNVVAWHIANSGLPMTMGPDEIVDSTLFSGENLNRGALDKFEKDVVKAHMYQKHLWDYMGTMSVYSPISKRALERDGYDYNDYVPIFYKVSHKEKSPISNILSADEKTVPIYAYNDGSISPNYNSKKARISFNSLQDNSGFDWARKGWDPNYEIAKEWHGTFTKSGEWVETTQPSPRKPSVVAFSDMHPLTIQVIKSGNDAILYDPYYEFMYAFMMSAYSADDNAEEINSERIAATVASVKNALSSLGVKKISSIVRNPYADRMSDEDKKDIPLFSDIISDDSKVSGVYRRIFGDAFADKVEFKELNQVRSAQKSQEENYKKDVRNKNGEDLALRFDFAIKNGFKGDDVVQAVFTKSARMPLNYKIAGDLQYAGLNQNEIAQVAGYEIPPSKSSSFNRALFNALAEFDTFKGSEYSKSELIDDVYNKVIVGKQLFREVDVESTLDDLFATGLNGLTEGTLTESEREEFETAEAEILRQAHPSYRDRLASVLANARKGYNLVKKNVGLTPFELLTKARDAFKKENNLIADVGITYKSFAKRDVQEEKIRLFDTVDIDSFISKSESGESKRRVRDFSLELSEFAKSERKEFNLFVEEDAESFIKSDLFVSSQVSEERVREIIDDEKAIVEDSLEHDQRAKVETIREIPLPLIYADAEHLDFSSDAESADDAGYLNNVLGKGYADPKLFAEGAAFYAYLMNAALSDLDDSGSEQSGATKTDVMKSGESLESKKDSKKKSRDDGSDIDAARKESKEESFEDGAEPEKHSEDALEHEDDEGSRGIFKKKERKAEADERDAVSKKERKAEADERDAVVKKERVDVQEVVQEDAQADERYESEGFDDAEQTAVSHRDDAQEYDLSDDIGRSADEKAGRYADEASDRKSAEKKADRFADDAAGRKPADEKAGRPADEMGDRKSAEKGRTYVDGEEDGFLTETGKKSKVVQESEAAEAGKPVREQHADSSDEQVAYKWKKPDVSNEDSYETKDGKSGKAKQDAIEQKQRVDIRNGADDAVEAESDAEEPLDDNMSEAFDFSAGVTKIYDRNSFTDDGVVYVDKKGEKFVIVNDLAKDYKYKVPAEVESDVRPKGSKSVRKSESYMDRVRGRSKRVGTPAGAASDMSLAKKIDDMLKEWAISEGFVYYNVGKKQTVYDKNLAIYGFSKKFSNGDYYSYFRDKVSSPGRTEDEASDDVSYADDVKDGASEQQEYKPTFTGYPDFNKQNKERAEAVKKGKPKPKEEPVESEEAEMLRRSTERYLEDKKQMDSFVESCIKEANESKIMAQAERAEKVMISSIISALENGFKK